MCLLPHSSRAAHVWKETPNKSGNISLLVPVVAEVGAGNKHTILAFFEVHKQR